MTDKGRGDQRTPAIWDRLTAKKYIDTKLFSGMNKDEVAKEIQRQLHNLPDPKKGERGDPRRLEQNNFGRTVVESLWDEVKKHTVVGGGDGPTQKELYDKAFQKYVDEDLVFIENRYRGQPAIRVYDREQYENKDKRGPPRLVTWTTKRRAKRDNKTLKAFVTDRLKERGTG